MTTRSPSYGHLFRDQSANVTGEVEILLCEPQNLRRVGALISALLGPQWLYTGSTKQHMNKTRCSGVGDSRHFKRQRSRFGYFCINRPTSFAREESIIIITGFIISLFYPFFHESIRYDDDLAIPWA